MNFSTDLESEVGREVLPSTFGCFFLPFVKPFKVFDEQYFEFSSQNKEIILFWTKV